MRRNYTTYTAEEFRRFIREFRQRTPSAVLSSHEVADLWQQIETQNRKNKINSKRRYWIAATIAAAAAAVCLFLFNPFTVEESIDYQSLITSLPQEKSQDIQLLSDKEKLLIKGKECRGDTKSNPNGILFTRKREKNRDGDSIM